MLSPELNSLIEASLMDGVLTEQERAVIKKRALLEGVDPDEIDLLINAKLQQMQNEAQSAVSKVRKCPACGAIISYMQTHCPQCGTEIGNIGATKSVQKLSELINEATAKEFNKEKRFERIKNIIQSFPVPTTKEDIMEFLFMAAPNAKKEGGFISKLSPALLGGLIGFVIFFVLGFVSSVSEGIGKAFGSAFALAIFFGAIGAWIGHKSFKKKYEIIRDKNRMADVWRTKCEQVITKAKFTLRDDANSMSAINDIENQLKL